MNCLDDIRFEQFLQMRKEIRGSGQYLIVGIDAAKEKHRAFFGTAQGKTLLKNLVFDNTIEGFEKLDAYVERVKVQHSLSKVVFGIEPTANYHKPLGEHLIKCGRLVVLVGGVAVKNNRQLLNGRWDKNDDKDSANVADLIAQGKCLFYEYPLMTLQNVRILNALKRRLKKREHGISACIRNNIIAHYFPELDKHYGPSETLAVVRECLDPSAIAGMEYDDFCRTVAPGKMTLVKERRVGGNRPARLFAQVRLTAGLCLDHVIFRALYKCNQIITFRLLDLEGVQRGVKVCHECRPIGFTEPHPFVGSFHISSGVVHRTACIRAQEINQELS